MNTRSMLSAAGRNSRTKNISTRAQNITITPIKEMMMLAHELQGQILEEIISFGQGVPYFDTPEYIKDGIRRALNDKKTARYTMEPGIPELRELIAKELETSKRVPPMNAQREVVVTSGCQEAIACALATVLDAEDDILVLEPAFPSHIEQTRQFGGNPIFVPFAEEQAWNLRLQDVEAAITEKTKAILFSHPSNPTGTVLEKETLKGLLEIADKHDLIVISDETYDYLVYDGLEHVSPASFPEHRERVIVCGSFSKKYAMTGYRVGYAFADAGIVDHMLKVHDALAICAPAISQMAAIAALRGPTQPTQEFVEKLTQNRELMCSKLDQMNALFEYQKPKGAYYIFAKYKLPGTASFDLALRTLNEAHVIVIPGLAFGPSGEDHVRFSFACSPEEIEEGFSRLQSWAKTL